MRRATIRRATVIAVAVAIAVAIATTSAVAAFQAWANTISATSTNTATTFTFRAFSVQIINDGPQEIYVDLTDTVAVADITDSSNVEIRPGVGQTFMWNGNSDPATDGFTGFGVICDGGETATVRVTATR